MAKSKGITIDDWLSELEKITAGPKAEGMTMYEIADAIGCSKDTVRAMLRRMRKADLVTVGRATRERIDGLWQAVPVYQLKGSGK